MTDYKNMHLCGCSGFNACIRLQMPFHLTKPDLYRKTETWEQEENQAVNQPVYEHASRSVTVCNGSARPPLENESALYWSGLRLGSDLYGAQAKEKKYEEERRGEERRVREIVGMNYMIKTSTNLLHISPFNIFFYIFSVDIVSAIYQLV